MKKKNNLYNPSVGIPVLFLAIFCLWIGSWLFIYYCIDSNNRGPFGDQFGFINSLFSGLAFGGVIYTILLQKQELEEQRMELRQTRYEFQVNRITNIIFNQLKFVNASIDNSVVSLAGTKHESSIGIVKLIENLVLQKTNLDRLTNVVAKNPGRINERIKHIEGILFENYTILNTVFENANKTFTVLNTLTSEKNITIPKVEIEALSTIIELNLGRDLKLLATEIQDVCVPIMTGYPAEIENYDERQIKIHRISGLISEFQSRVK